MESVLSQLNINNFTMDNLTLTTNRKQELLIEQYRRNRSIDDSAYYILIVLYSILIIFGATGNSLVVMAVVRKPQMRTARNMFIVNLAISDLLLCLITMPLTLVQIISKYWPLGRNAIFCKMISTLQATSIFVSTISITAIALDRYQVIVYPTRDSLQFMGAVLILTGIWIFSVVLATPMYLFHSLVNYDADIHIEGLNLKTISYCVEDWPIENGRVYYSVFSLIMQYIVPILIVSAAYFRIYYKLKHRLVITGTSIVGASASGRTTTEIRDRERGRRMQRTNYLLISIAVIFGISWLPLNLFNLFADIYLARNPITQGILVTYAVCHMMGMMTACSNPLLYGWLNDNFRKEFNEILCRHDASILSLGNGKMHKSRRQSGQELTHQVGHKSRGNVDTAVTDINGGVQTELTVLVR